MARKTRKTLRRMPPKARAVAEIANDLHRLSLRAHRLAEELSTAEQVASHAMKSRDRLEPTDETVRKLDEKTSAPCTRCGLPIETLARFPGGRCLGCYEADYCPRCIESPCNCAEILTETARR